MTRVIFVRYGRKQAEALAKRLQQFPFTALYSSDLGRALETAGLVSDEDKAIKVLRLWTHYE